MKYILLLFMLVYFEFLGASITSVFKIKKLSINFALGFFSFVASLYVFLFPVIFFKLKFIFICIVILAVFLLGLILILYTRPRIEINKLQIAIVFLAVAVFIHIQYNKSLGDYYALDTITYLDYNTNYINGEYGAYAFQSYYQLLAFICKILTSYYNLFGQQVLYSSIFVWYGAIFNYFCISSVTLNIIEILEIKKSINIIVFCVMSLFFVGMIQNNIECAFIGNCYRLSLCAMLFNYTYLYFKSLYDNYLFVIGLLVISLCAFANNHIFLISLFSFVFWIVSSNHKNTIRYICVWLFLPLLNLIYMMFNNYRLLMFTLVLLLIAALYFVYKFDDKLHILINKKHVKKLLLTFVFISITLINFSVEGLTFDAFLNNASNGKDLVWEYNRWDNVYQIIGNIILLIPLAISFIRYKNDEIFNMVFLLVLLFMLPCQAGLFNKINIVFYRMYALAINPFTIIYSYNYIMIKSNYIKQATIGIILLMLLSYLSIKNIQFCKNSTLYNIKDGYNHIKKVTTNEYDVIVFLKNYIYENNLSNYKVITSLPLVTTEIYGLKPMYGRQKSLMDNRYPELASVFYPAEFNSNHTNNKDRLCYENVYKNLLNSDYEIIVLDKGKEYEDYNNHYLSIYDKINESTYPIYENESYAIYHIKH